MTTPRGIVAPEGYLWARDHVGRWHGLRIADLTDEGGDYRRMVRSVCGEWASTTPWTAGHWAEITRWLPPAPDLCYRCLKSGAGDRRRAPGGAGGAGA